MSKSHLKLVKGGKDDSQVKDTMEDVTDAVEQTPIEQEESPRPVVIRLTTGEDIITQIVGSDANTITVANSLVVVIQPREGGNLGMTLAPFFMPYARGPVRINTGNVVAFLQEVDPNLLDSYQKFFSPIIQPPSGIIS